jgi:O-antigen ligase
LFASVVAAGSRAGAVLCAGLLVLIPMTAYAQGWIPGRSLIRLLGQSLVAAAALVAVAGWEPIWARLQEPNPYSLRADLLRSTVDMARDRPILGFGLGAWASAYPSYARFDDGSFVNQAHNDWAQWAAEGGIPFLLLMLAVVIPLIRPAIQSLWGLGLMAVFVHAFVDYPMQQRPALAAYFFALAGVLTTSSPAAHFPGGLSQLWTRSKNSPPAD